MVDLPPSMPSAMAKLPVNKVGYPVPWFVAKIDGEWDFRVIRPGGIDIALAKQLCWVCGTKLTPIGLHAFVVGPMCAVNRTSMEPPSHLACARWSAIACPFLARPSMSRRTTGKPENAVVAGQMITRNPGVALVWKVAWGAWSVYRTGPAAHDKLFNLGTPSGCEWYAEGRAATRAEVLASIESGVPLLRAEVDRQREDEGVDYTSELDAELAAAMRLIPA